MCQVILGTAFKMFDLQRWFQSNASDWQLFEQCSKVLGRFKVAPLLLTRRARHCGPQSVFLSSTTFLQTLLDLRYLGSTNSIYLNVYQFLRRSHHSSSFYRW
jgi:hypothetical protein